MESHILFGKRVRSVRTAAKSSRESVAERAGITPNYLGQIERGEKWPTLEVLVKIADSLSVSPETFFDFEIENESAHFLHRQISALLADKDTKQLQQALRVLRALLAG